MDSQKVRLALEERGIDYTSFHVNPITGKNMDSLFFRMNTSAKLPVLQNGAHIIYDTVEIIQYASSFSLTFFFLFAVSFFVPDGYSIFLLLLLTEIFDLVLGSNSNRQ